MCLETYNNLFRASPQSGTFPLQLVRSTSLFRACNIHSTIAFCPGYPSKRYDVLRIRSSEFRNLRWCVQSEPDKTTLHGARGKLIGLPGGKTRKRSEVDQEGIPIG